MTRVGVTRMALGLAGVVLLGGCSTLAGDGPRRAQPDLVDLADRVRALEEKVAAQAVEIERLQGDRPAIPAGGGASAAAAEARPAAREAGEPLAPSSPLPATVEVSDLEDLAPPPSAATAAEAGAALGEEKTAYEAAAELYRQGRPAEAEAAFQRFLAAHAEGELADNALFWIGASRLARGELAGAEEAFRRVVELYPEGNKVPDSLWKLGNCRAMAGDPAGAEAAFRTLVERFPASEPAELAARRLAGSAATP